VTKPAVRRLHRNLGVKYDKAVECLIRIATRCFLPSTTSRLSTEASANDQPHRKLIRDGSPPNSALQRCSPNKTALAMIFKLAEAAEKNWRRLDGQPVAENNSVRFTDGIEVVAESCRRCCLTPSVTKIQ
jgi:hypothetical protein